MKNKLILIFVFIVVLFFASIYFFLYEAQLFFSRANLAGKSISVENSYFFITPLRARANRQEKIRLTIYALDNRGLGIFGKQVFLGENENLDIEIIQGVTDAFGKAIFDISARQPGDYYLEVRIDDKKLPQKAHLTFY
jgi:hypothetical protein